MSICVENEVNHMKLLAKKIDQIQEDQKFQACFGKDRQLSKKVPRRIILLGDREMH